jgi:heme/copper-type cytochrome/quinol oxidase subunit 3
MSADTLIMPRRLPPAAPAAPPVSNTRLAMAVLIVGETMLFAGLIGAYLVFRLAGEDWPPADQPRLPLLLTGLNTIVLLGSLVPVTQAMRAIRRDHIAAAARALALTTLLGALFLAVQGLEWVRLVRHGLTLGSSMYGATFYALIGCHGLHVLAAVTWLAITTLLTRRGRFDARRNGPLEMCGIYWYFVCALWVVLFPLVYLY